MSDIPKTVEALIERIKELEETNLNNAANYQLQVAELSAANKAANDIIGAQANANDKLVAQLSAAIKVKDEALKTCGIAIDELLGHCKIGECEVCSLIICPFKEPLHFHHDGCPSCCNEPESEQDKVDWLNKALSLTPPDALKEYLQKTIYTLQRILAHGRIMGDCESICVMAGKELTRLTGGGE